MEKKRVSSAAIMTALTLVALCLVLITATYAWFTFDPYTNVTPMEGKISKGDANLLISESRNGPFGKECPLNPADFAQELRPVSTADLAGFYTSIAQNREGYSVAFQDVSGKLGQYLIHGTVYLQCQEGSCDVFFQPQGQEVGGDAQALAAGRLGLRITGADNKPAVFLFKLDSLGSTDSAQLKQTIQTENAVIAGIDADGVATFVTDPARSLTDYRQDAQNPKKLLSLASEEIAQVEYWLYLEGCDDACFNPVQSRNVSLQLAFSGKSTTDAAAAEGQ